MNWVSGSTVAMRRLWVGSTNLLLGSQTQVSIKDKSIMVDLSSHSQSPATIFPKVHPSIKLGLTFRESARRGLASAQDIDDWVEYWHTAPAVSVDCHTDWTAYWAAFSDAATLRELLGFTQKEYQEWVFDGEALLGQIFTDQASVKV